MSCGSHLPSTNFYSVQKSAFFPQGKLTTCTDCIKKEIDPKEIDTVTSFLRQIDKPFLKDAWDASLNSKGYDGVLGDYMRKINSLKSFKDKTFADSDFLVGGKDIEIESTEKMEEEEVFIYTNEGEKITLDNEIRFKWGAGYKDSEYLQLEKFYRDMHATHEITTAVHEDLLRQLCYMSVEQDKLRQDQDWRNYNALRKTFKDVMTDAGFKPSDKKAGTEANGVVSFAEVFDMVEQKGFRKPAITEFNEDIVDKMLVILLNYYHRVFGKEILAKLPDDVREEVGEFYELNTETGEDINEAEYDNIDYSVDEMETDDASDFGIISDEKEEEKSEGDE